MFLLPYFLTLKVETCHKACTATSASLTFHFILYQDHRWSCVAERAMIAWKHSHRRERQMHLILRHAQEGMRCRVLVRVMKAWVAQWQQTIQKSQMVRRIHHHWLVHLVLSTWRGLVQQRQQQIHIARKYLYRY